MRKLGYVFPIAIFVVLLCHIWLSNQTQNFISSYNTMSSYALNLEQGLSDWEDGDISDGELSNKIIDFVSQDIPNKEYVKGTLNSLLTDSENISVYSAKELVTSTVSAYYQTSVDRLRLRDVVFKVLCTVLVIGNIVVLILYNSFNEKEKKGIKKNDDIESCTDALTGLWNRKFIEEKLALALQKKSYKGYLFMCDMDKFKTVNDTLGHDVGDEVLQEFALVCKNTLRPGDYICRYGGDEFIIYIPDLNNDAQAKMIYNRLQENLRLKFKDTPKHIVTLSCGATKVRQNMTVDELRKEADQALYIVKENGRNNITIYDRN